MTGFPGHITAFCVLKTKASKISSHLNINWKPLLTADNSVPFTHSSVFGKLKEFRRESCTPGFRLFDQGPWCGGSRRNLLLLSQGRTGYPRGPSGSVSQLPPPLPVQCILPTFQGRGGTRKKTAQSSIIRIYLQSSSDKCYTHCLSQKQALITIIIFAIQWNLAQIF